MGRLVIVSRNFIVRVSTFLSIFITYLRSRYFERVIIEEYMNGDLIASLLNSVRFLFICLLFLFFKLIHFERAERKEEI